MDMVARLQLDLDEMRAESRCHRTPGGRNSSSHPRQVTFTSTKVPKFDGVTSSEQYQQVFDAIVQSNGWDDATAALQLLSHLEGDALNVALLVLESKRALETLAIKAFGDMGQTARLRIIRDRFVAGHDSCQLRRHLDSVLPETPIRDIVDRCRVWESHADSDDRRFSKPGHDRTL